MKVGIQMVVDDGTQDLLGLALTAGENSAEAVAMVRQIVRKVGAEVLVSDDLGSYQQVADELGLDHQICRKHVKDNVASARTTHGVGNRNPYQDVLAESLPGKGVHSLALHAATVNDVPVFVYRVHDHQPAS